MPPIVLINPNLVVQRNDPFTTGIVYMPIGMAYTAATLRQAGYDVRVIDAYAEAPRNTRREGKFTLYGLSDSQILARVPTDAQIIFLYAINLTNHISSMGIIRALKEARPELAIIVFENTQAVTAYALNEVQDELFGAGADYFLSGEPDLRAVELANIMRSTRSFDDFMEVDGIGSPHKYHPPANFIQELDSLPFPAWDLFPLENYWSLRFAHGPLTADRYLPILTSRGCPYPCRFCVVPATNRQKWRSRSAINVVDEMVHHNEKFAVSEFHIEDLDPTISDDRIRAICREIISRDLKVSWKIAAGTKVETIQDEETIDLMAQAGCSYISISPETGSPRLLKSMRKPFDLEHAVRLVRRMNQRGIRSQACFVLGFPGEDDEDRERTWDLVHDLARKGVDEIALFIITPVPGSDIFDEYTGYSTLSDLNFSPTWRQDYHELSRFRLRLYAHFLWWKLRHHPIKLVEQPINFLRRRFKTKMEMVPYRAMVLKWLDKRSAQ